MKNFSSLFLWHRSRLVNSLEELTVFAVFHEDVYLIVLSDDLIDLGDVLVKEILLKFYLALDGLELVRFVLLDSCYFDSNGLTCKFMDCLFHLSEASFTNRLF
jgi:hypothetical protein